MKTNNHIATLLTAGLLLAIISSPEKVSADTLLGIYAGFGTWDVSMDGSLGVDDTPITTGELGIEDDQSLFFYIALEHPVPVLPNIRLQRVTLENSGYAMVDRAFTFNDLTFPAQAPTTTKLELTLTDLTLYYEVLDNWVSLDIGLTAKNIDGYGRITAEPDGLAAVDEKTDFNGTLPMLYGMARFDLPLTGMYAGGHLNYISYDNSSVSDFDIKLGWMYESVLDAGLELGYRKFAIELKDFDESNADLTYDGLYLNIAVHF